MPKLRSDDDDSERQTEDATLNVDLKTDDGSERRTQKRQWWLWTPKLKSNDDDPERQTEKW